MPKRTPPTDGDNVVPLPPRARHVFTPEQGAKGLAAAKVRNHKPARGGPARSTRDDKSGAGWGGAANGAGDRRPMTPQHPEHAHNLPPEVRAIKAAGKEARIEALNDKLLTIALTSENEQTALNATIAGLDRLVGKPMQTSITATVGDVSNMDEDELEQEIEAARRALGAA